MLGVQRRSRVSRNEIQLIFATEDHTKVTQSADNTVHLDRKWVAIPLWLGSFRFGSAVMHARSGLVDVFANIQLVPKDTSSYDMDAIGVADSIEEARLTDGRPSSYSWHVVMHHKSLTVFAYQRGGAQRRGFTYLQKCAPLLTTLKSIGQLKGVSWLHQ